MNCFKKRTSFSEYKRKSFTLYFNCVILSIPIPNANPEYSFESIPQDSKTAGSTIPHPKISNHPEYLQTLHPFELQIVQDTSTSALGSVNGKYDGRKRICAFSPNISLAKYNNVCFKSANETFLSIYNY